MKNAAVFGVCLLPALLVWSAAKAACATKPNVLLIISDDQGYGDLGFTGNKAVKTPHLDRLASESAVFKNFVVAPACSPTRISLLTGRQHLLTGTWGVGHRANVHRDEVRMPRYFQAAGYATGFFGKRDSIQWLEQTPWELGCDEFEGVWGYVHRDARFFTRNGIVQRKGWTCDVDVANALEFISRHRNQPWWCTVAFILPHLPWEPDERFAKPYRDAGCSQTLAACLGSLSQLDDAVGRLLKGLAELGQAEDTIVIFLSDNGPSYLGLTEEEARVRNPLGLKGGKATVWENGIRVPLVVRWPHRIKPGERPQFGAVEDILPTLVELTGLDTAKFPRHLPWHGISLRDALENPDAPQAERAVFRVGIAGEGAVGGKRAFVSDPAKLPMSEQHVVLRGPRYKFHQFAGGKTALFDVVADPAEADDMSSRFPDITRRYADELRRQYRQIAESGRALRMPVVLVGEPGPGRNRLDGVMAQRATGNVHGAGASAIRGFTSPTDAVEYAIEVTKAGRYDITVTGKNLDSVRRWLLEIADLAVAPKTAAAEQLEFGPVAVAAGPATVRLSAQEHTCGTQTHAVIARISFRLRSEQDRGILPVR